MFKTPILNKENPRFKNGTAFFYLDNNNTTLIEADADVDSNYDPLYFTLIPLYIDGPNIGWALLNDQSPNYTASSTRAHQKGILMFDETTALYIEHSTPKYPNDPWIGEKYEFASNGKTNGQAFLCMNLDSDGLKKVTDAFLIQRPYFYSWRLPSYTSSRAPSLERAINNSFVQSI